MTVTRAKLLYGTDEPAAPPRVLRAGALSAELEAGNLRYIRFGGAEMIRAVSFLVRSRHWATFAPEIADLLIYEDAARFEVTYRATVRDGASVLRYDVQIEGKAGGSLSFAADARAETDVLTCRTGFVVLHPIEGVAGAAVRIEHADGIIEDSRFPALIDPIQPMMNLRALTHAFAPGAHVTCRMEGDVFEMEDQRNWTDASYKTYSRPLTLPWPYTLAAGETVQQAVRLTVSGTAPAKAAGAVVRLAVGEVLGTMPPVVLACDPHEAALALPHAVRVAEAGVAGLVCRFDARLGHDAAALAPVRDLATRLGLPVEVQLVVPTVENFAAGIAFAAAQIRTSGLAPASVTVSPAADLKSTPPGSIWPPCPPADAVLRAARAAFPGVPLGGGMLSYFTELNRKRPPLDLIDFVAFSTSALVHAGDDRSALETLEALPAIAASARAIAGGLPLRVGPSAIGMRDNPYGAGPLPNPDGARMAMAGRDPRQTALFNAAWTLGYIARFAEGGAARIAVSAPLGDFGIMDEDQLYPVYWVIQGLAALNGQTLRAVASSNAHDLLALQAGDTLYAANLTGGPLTLETPAGFGGGVAILDAACGPDWRALRTAPAAAVIDLDAFAVIRLTRSSKG